MTTARHIEPGLVLTFDDAHVKEWVAAMPIFERHGAHATFFVSGFDRLTPEQLAGLHMLKRAGHAIGCHGLRHIKAVDGVRERSIEAYMQSEIEPAVALMASAGFVPSSFAYPCSQRDDITDAALLRVFRHLRSGVPLPAGKRMAELDEIFVPAACVADKGCLLGKGLDGADDALIGQVTEALDRAGGRDEIVVFYAHNISDAGPGHHLAPAQLEHVLAHAAGLGLRCCTYDELP